ncbi:MAG TPA: universal stress protein [Ramlibacter sp.]|jgi:nucleotide-binding universal stress UspA family protein
MRTYRRILVPVDGSPTSNKALVAALNIARDGDGQLRIVHVVDEVAHLTGFEASSMILAAAMQAAERVLADAAEIAKASGVTADVKLLDQPGERLGVLVAKEAQQWEADLVVVGTHGRRGFERMLVGSGAEQIIRLAPVPVLVIRGDAND